MKRNLDKVAVVKIDSFVRRRYKFIKKLIALLIALVMFFTQKRLGMTAVSFLMADLILREGIKFDIKMLKNTAYAIILFVIGYLLSTRTTYFYYHLSGSKSFTFIGGFFGGIVETESYLLFALFPFKFLIDKNIKNLLKYIVIISIIFSGIGGLVQGAYNAGWQNTFYV